MYWKLNNVLVVSLLGLVTTLAASECATFDLYAIKPKGDDFVVSASSDSFENDLVRTFGKREKLTWGHKFLTSVCLLYTECYGSPETDVVFANCYSNGLQYIRRNASPPETAQRLEDYINGMPNDVRLGPNCKEPKVELEKTPYGTVIKGSGLTGKVIEVTINDSESMRRVRVEDLLNLMCREFARCLRTLKQAPVEHQCASIGTKEIANSHLELMVMQLQLYMTAVVHGEVDWEQYG